VRTRHRLTAPPWWYSSSVRWLCSIGFLLTLLSLFAVPAVATTPATCETLIVSNEFCGKQPSAEVLCPDTGLDECLCFLSQKTTIQENLTFEAANAPKTRSKRPNSKPILLEKTSYRPADQLVLASTIERPPRFS
jgi:hypothetical protein